jgi:hypothetical protein
MTPEYVVYLNDYYFVTLASSLVFDDRPEPYRLHEQKLWTIYQLLKLGEHEVVITDQAKQPVLKTKRSEELKAWFSTVYPTGLGQLDQPVYTRLPHPASYSRLA